MKTIRSWVRTLLQGDHKGAMLAGKEKGGGRRGRARETEAKSARVLPKRQCPIPAKKPISRRMRIIACIRSLNAT